MNNTNSKIAIVVVLAAVAFFIFYNSFETEELQQNEKEKSLVEISGSQEELPKLPNEQPQNESIVQADIENLEESKQAMLLAQCGIDGIDSVQEIVEAFNLDLGELSEIQMKALENYESNDGCVAWYDYVKSTHNDKVNKLQSRLEVEKKNINTFSATTNHAEKMVLAKKVVKGESSSFHHDVALGYLLRNDPTLAQLIADDIQTNNVSYVQNQADDVLKIYQCKMDYSYCSKESRRMALKCLRNEENCNIDYITYIERSRSINEVSDLHNMVSALISILESGYPYS